ncbi:hypothetical protein AZE42_10796 [Rhizopogon vesiculosus]|uniref:Uncharacterized protein n=1 Tax=Rhizopogon vesiculosus TaxID=180088 RepID=A0A1J8PTD7_9AGAM|nr:hypothetical protein AZE42_10796 [Rhizopogon vesiculosus]
MLHIFDRKAINLPRQDLLTEASILLKDVHLSTNPFRIVVMYVFLVISQLEPAERGSSSVRNGFVSPESRKRPRRSPTPSPSPQRAQSFTPKCNDSRPSASCIGPGLSAYTFDDDPDANWSTITKHTKKNSKSLKPSVARCSGPSRLPAPAVGNGKGESKSVTRTEKKQGSKTKRRIITYLPPPPSQRTVANLKKNYIEASTHILVSFNIHTVSNQLPCFRAGYFISSVHPRRYIIKRITT